MTKISISGFMALQNAVETGYPFVESIASALPICDEFLIADGYSSDGTWDCLNELKRRYPDRIKLYQDQWPAWRNYGKVMVTVSNALRARCRGDYCLYVQANEVMHEASLDEIRRLPLLNPGIELFRFPYCNYLGPDDQVVFDFRRRLFANTPRIALVGDAYDAGYLRWPLMKTPRRFLRYLLHREGEKACYLRDPYHRYWGIFPTGYLTKLKQRSAAYDNEQLAPAWTRRASDRGAGDRGDRRGRRQSAGLLATARRPAAPGPLCRQDRRRPGLGPPPAPGAAAVRPMDLRPLGQPRADRARFRSSAAGCRRAARRTRGPGRR